MTKQHAFDMLGGFALHDDDRIVFAAIDEHLIGG